MKEHLRPVVNSYRNQIWHEIIRGMLSYTVSGMPERGPFTKALFRLLKAMFGYASNPQGSFTSNNAGKVLGEEGGEDGGDLWFGYDVTGFFERLEDGTVDFRWIWDKFLEDSIKEGWFKAKWKPLIGGTDYATLQKGPPASTEPRPYVGNVMESNSDNFADAVHHAVESGLMDRGYRVEVRIR